MAVERLRGGVLEHAYLAWPHVADARNLNLDRFITLEGGKDLRKAFWVPNGGFSLVAVSRLTSFALPGARALSDNPDVTTVRRSAEDE